MSLGDLYRQASLYREQLEHLAFLIGEENALNIHHEVKAEANAYNLITATQRLNTFVQLAARGFSAEDLLKAAVDHNETKLLYAYDIGLIRPDATSTPPFPKGFMQAKVELDDQDGLMPHIVKESILAQIEPCRIEPPKED